MSAAPRSPDRRRFLTDSARMAGGCALAGTALAYLLYYRIVAQAGSGNAMLVTLIIPPFGILLGWALLDERLAPQAYAGLALIALGLAVIDGRPWAALRRATT